MQSHPFFAKAFVLAACACPLQLHTQQRAIAKTADPQFMLKWIAATGVVCCAVHSYYATCKQDQKIVEQLQVLEKLSEKYQGFPEALSLSQLAQRCMENNGKRHTLHAERDAIVADQKTLQTIDSLLLAKSSTKIQTARQKIQTLLKKLRSIEHSVALAIAPFDLATCTTKHAEQFKKLIEAHEQGTLHEALCITYQHDLYPYVACTEDIKRAIETIKKIQSKVDKQCDVFNNSELLCNKLHTMVIFIISYYQIQKQQMSQDMKKAEALSLQHKQVVIAQKQTRILDAIKQKIQQLLAKHDEQLRINYQHLTTFNSLTAQLSAHHTTRQEKELALMRLAANATRSAQETQGLIRLQQQELKIAQEMQEVVAHPAEHVSSSPQQLNIANIPEDQNDLDSPGASPLPYATNPSAPPASSAYPQVAQNAYPEGQKNN